jgi:uncharacterized protein YqgV (UPF0045/DUF77 family)
MAFNDQERELWDVARSALPRVLVGRLPVVGRRIDGLWTAYVKIFQRAREVMLEFFYGSAYISTSSDEWTDEHAKDADTRRQTGEDNDTLIARLRTVDDAVTKPAILAKVNAILAAAGVVGVAGMTEIWQQGAYYQVVDGWRQMYLGRGFRFGHLQPGLIVVVLPYGTSAETAAAVDEAVRMLKAGGFHHIIETRTTP